MIMAVLLIGVELIERTVSSYSKCSWKRFHFSQPRNWSRQTSGFVLKGTYSTCRTDTPVSESLAVWVAGAMFEGVASGRTEACRAASNWFCGTTGSELVWDTGAATVGVLGAIAVE